MRHLFPLRRLVRRLNFLLWLKSSTLTVRPEIRERKLDTKMTKELDTDPILISLLFFFSLGTKNERKRPDTRPIPVADGWAGAQMRVFPLSDSITTDQPTDQPTNRRTDGQSLL